MHNEYNNLTDKMTNIPLSAHTSNTHHNLKSGIIETWKKLPEKGNYIMKENNNINRRRERGNGSIRYDVKSCMYISTFSITVHGERYRKSISCKTEAEAEKALKQCKRLATENVQHGKLRKTRTYSLSVVAEQMMNDIKATVDDKTYEQYSYLQNIISTGAIWNSPITNITSSNIQRFINDINNNSAHHITASTIKKVVAFLKRIFTYASVNKMNPYNPLSSTRCIKIPKSAVATKPKPRAITSEECTQILAVVEQSSIYRVIVYLLLYTGIRIGELLALSWDEVDLEKGRLSVRYALKRRVQDVAEKPKRYYERVKEPKTASSVRDIPLSKNLVTILYQWRAMQKNGKTDDGITLSPDKTGLNLVFPNQFGNLRSYDGTARRFRFFLEKHGLDSKVYHFHAFRHTFASYLAKRKVAPQTMKALLGHTDIKTTLNYYVDADLDSQMAAIEELDTIIGGLISNENDFEFDIVS